MDFRDLDLTRIAVSEMKKPNKSIKEVIDLLVKTDREFFLNEEKFKTKDPLMNASQFLYELIMTARRIDEDEEFSKYKEFFDEHFTNAKKDIISGEFLEKVDGLWQPVLNRLDAVKSYANGKKLKPKDISMHLERYILQKEKELLVDIPDWDGVDRIKELGQYIKLKGHAWDIFEDAFKEWLANVFRRLYEPNAQNRCIILKGDQGIGKDNLVRNLLGAFGCYYSKFTNNRDERAIWDQVTGGLVLHIEEFDQTGSLGVPFLKDIITRDLVTYRSPYAKAAKSRKCVGSFISTVNIDAVLRDETGNRRFAVFEVESIDWSYPKDMASQILAQSYALYRADYRASKDTWLAVMKANAQFEQVDLVPELLSMWDARVKGRTTPMDDNGLSFNAVNDIASDLVKSSGWKMKTILSMLKTNGRSRHSMTGARYFHYDLRNEKSKLSIVSDTNDRSHIEKRNVPNFAPKSDRS